ncbi:hypothetical protein Afil01_15590 [Actinorhabdospora filicis]|uniref:Uncharacterized protein n=1 Tax=Actinorhabdospora filicis TaxID=1785913 RepID=A0A9W6SIU2_9ACTN|nr:hypothetical protein [Actinorhabdospora filicis]GLZ76752.1 hypothetical protein Afil01_15590 [Actinorhabdospora filicis]
MHRKAHELGLTGFTLGLRQFDRYLAAESTRMRPVTAEVLRAVFGMPATDLLAPAPSTSDADPLGQDASRDHAVAIAAADLSEAPVEQLRAEVRRHARDYAHLAPGSLLPRLLRTRDLAYALLETTRRPRHCATLLAIAGQVCALAATTAYDLGDPDAADDHARAAGIYADIAEQPALTAWVRGTRATIAFWSRRPREALDHVAGGLAHASGTTARRLHAVAARAHALLGSRREALAAVDAAGRCHGADSLATDVGGEFGFPPARLSMCTAAVHLSLGDGDHAALSAQQAIAMYERTPVEQRRFGVLAGASMDLAAARILRDELDGVRDALEPALGLDPARRTARLTERLGGIRGRLASPRFKKSRAAVDLRETIDAFTAGAHL